MKSANEYNIDDSVLNLEPQDSDECDLLIRDHLGNLKINYDAEFYKHESKRSLWDRIMLPVQTLYSFRHSRLETDTDCCNSKTNLNIVSSKKGSSNNRGCYQEVGASQSIFSCLIDRRILRWLRLIILIIFGLVLLFLLSYSPELEIQDTPSKIIEDSVTQQAILEHESSRWLVASSKCNIPLIEPWHESIEADVKLNEPENCQNIFKEVYKLEQPLIFQRNGRIHLSKYGRKMKADCCFRSIERESGSDSELKLGDICEQIFSNSTEIGIKIPHKLIRVECSNFNYTDIFTFIIHDEEEEASMIMVANKKLNRQDYYNILMVGVDTISRLNGLRQLNETLTILRKLYGTNEFVGYNKVGENTFPNMIPLLTGLTPEELVSSRCWQATDYSQESESGNDYLDNCKFLWNFYQELGYITYYSEDWPSASTFNYLKKGFRSEPTLHYGRPFTLAREDILLPEHKSMSCPPCFKNRPVVEVDLENLKNFINEYSNSPYLAFHWINCPTHNDLNSGSTIDHILANFFKSIQPMTQADKTFVIFFSDHGYRWNPFISTRVGHYESSLPMLTIAVPRAFKEKHPDLVANIESHRSTLLTPFDMFKTLLDLKDLISLQGSATNRPDLNIVPIMSEKSVNNNSTRPRLHITQLPDDPEEVGVTASTSIVQETKLDGSNYEHGFKKISILRANSKKILDRSCLDAGIPDNYCVCHEFSDTEQNDKIALGAAYHFVYQHLHETLKNHEHICEPLDLQSVEKAQVFDYQLAQARRKNESRTIHEQANDSDISRTLPDREYNLIITTKPGNGTFQEVIRYYGSKNQRDCISAIDQLDLGSNNLNHKERVKLIEEMNNVCKYHVYSESISRLNLYKEQSRCVEDNIELKKVCYCSNSNLKSTQNKTDIPKIH